MFSRVVNPFVYNLIENFIGATAAESENDTLHKPHLHSGVDAQERHLTDHVCFLIQYEYTLITPKIKFLFF